MVRPAGDWKRVCGVGKVRHLPLAHAVPRGLVPALVLLLGTGRPGKVGRVERVGKLGRVGMVQRVGKGGEGGEGGEGGGSSLNMLGCFQFECKV